MRGGGQGRDEIAQFAALDFLRGGQWQVSNESDETGGLVIGEALDAPGSDVACKSCVRVGLGERCRQRLPRPVSGPEWGDSDSGDGRVLAQGALDLDGGDIFAGAADDVLAAVDEVHGSVGTEADNVASVEPVVAQASAVASGP